MKKIQIFILIIASVSSFGSYPVVDNDGKLSDKGKSLDVRMDDFRNFCAYIIQASRAGNNFSDAQITAALSKMQAFWQFKKHNEEFYKWEIMKRLKKNYYKLKFFDPGYLDSDDSKYCLAYLMFDLPKPGDSMCHIIMKTNDICKEPGITEFIVKKTKMSPDRAIDKNRIFNKLFGVTTDYTVKDLTAIIQKAASGQTQAASTETKQTPGCIKTLSAMLDNKEVNPQNVKIFYKKLTRLDNIPDELIDRMIKYWGLDGSAGTLTLDTELACLPNKPAKLTKAILDNLTKVNVKSSESSPSNAIKLYRNEKVTLKNAPLTLLYFAYLCNDYNKAYKKGSDMKVKASDLIYLLGRHSNLNESNAKKIIAALLNERVFKIRAKHAEISPRFAGLIQSTDFDSHQEQVCALAASCDQDSLNKGLLKKLTNSSEYQIRYAEAWRNAKAVLKQGSTSSVKTTVNQIDNQAKILQDYIDKLEKLPPDGDLKTIAKALQKYSIYGKPATAALLKNLKRKDIDFPAKIYILVALGEIGDRSSLPEIEKLFYNENKLVQNAARRALFLIDDIDVNHQDFKGLLR